MRLDCAQVTQDVYDSVVAFGQSRALVVWQRIILPDGSSIRIGNVPGADTEGYASLSDRSGSSVQNLQQERKDPVRWITREQAEHLLKELPEHQREVVMFALATGMRQGEALDPATSPVVLPADVADGGLAERASRDDEAPASE